MTKEMWQLARMHELKDFGERLSHYENDEMLIDEVDEGFCNDGLYAVGAYDTQLWESGRFDLSAGL
ncbi:MAG: hypothetical protein ACLSD6_03975 [Clostridium sp.]